MMILFHGTTVKSYHSIAAGINLSKSKESVDFGRGFYLTKDEVQAIEWVMMRQHPAVIKFQFDPKGLKKIEFKEPDERWARFVVANRLQLDLHRYDYAIGPMADSKVSRIQHDFSAGIITFEQAVECIVGHTNGSQVAVLSEKAVRHLQILEVRTHGLQERRSRILGLDSSDPS